jgi:hypothetical protein
MQVKSIENVVAKVESNTFSITTLNIIAEDALIRNVILHFFSTNAPFVWVKIFSLFFGV